MSCILHFHLFLFLLYTQGLMVTFMSLTLKILTFYCAAVAFFHTFSLIDATHKDVDVLLLLSNCAYYVA